MANWTYGIGESGLVYKYFGEYVWCEIKLLSQAELNSTRLDFAGNSARRSCTDSEGEHRS